MAKFFEPECEVVRFGNDVIVTSDCNCDWGEGPIGDDVICTVIGPGGDIQCIITDDQGNC